MIIQAERLTVAYQGGTVPALTNVSCSLDRQELLAVVGPNGGGKTTLLRAMLGMVPLQSGDVRVAGKEITQWKRCDLAEVIGVVAQREEMVYPLRVEETVMLGRYARLGPLAPTRPEDRAAVETALRRCDVWELRDRRTDTLSGGEWQRVRVARALAQEPRALLLDEPTAALDIRHEMEIFELVHRLVTEGLAALVITHHINLAARYATRMLLLSRGAVAAEGTPSEVLRREVLEPVFDWRVAVNQWTDGSPQIIPLKPSDTTVS
jgi:iron complex transport system ATP-binding protein